MDWLSFSEAISDLNLELFLTIVLLIILFIGGLLVGRWSLSREIDRAQYNQKDSTRKAWLNNFWQGISTELIGAVFTTIGFGLILVIFQQYQVVQNNKDYLTLQLSSPDNSIAIDGVRIARYQNWLTDGTLIGAQLSEANLQNADLTDANLMGAHLWQANLQAAFLLDAKLQDANLRTSNLIGADLGGAKLQRANLHNANLRGAILVGADLSGANLRNANLESVTWELDDEPPVILPDGTQWTSDTDLERFTDPNHDDFWQATSDED